MPALSTRRQYSYQDYLNLEAESNLKHEYLDGEIFAMAGGSPMHAAVALAVGAALRKELTGKPCRAYSADLRIRVLSTGLAAYPDVSVICGPLQPDPQSDVTACNPSLLVEVLSPSTAAYDRGEKFEHYKHISSLRTYLLVSAESPRVEAWQKESDGFWRPTVAEQGQTLTFIEPRISLDIDEVYRDLFV